MREEWINSTIPVLIDIFPVSSSKKVAQIQTINNAEHQNVDITRKDNNDLNKRKAEQYLKNYIEEIELLDLENRSDRIGNLFRSFSFWAILISAILLSFIGMVLMNPA